MQLHTLNTYVHTLYVQMVHPPYSPPTLYAYIAVYRVPTQIKVSQKSENTYEATGTVDICRFLTAFHTFPAASHCFPPPPTFFWLRSTAFQRFLTFNTFLTTSHWFQMLPTASWQLSSNITNDDCQITIISYSPPPPTSGWWVSDYKYQIFWGMGWDIQPIIESKTRPKIFQTRSKTN